MYTMHKNVIRCIAATTLCFALGSVQAAFVNYTITGDVVSGEEFAANAFGLSAGDTITASGTFDDSALSGTGDGTISFGAGSGNTMTISVGTETFTASNDVDYAAGGNPFIVLASFNTLTEFSFLAFNGNNGAPADFSSFLTSFDDLDQMFGDWQTTVSIQPVPVPAAVWLFGFGLLSLAGVARRKAG